MSLSKKIGISRRHGLALAVLALCGPVAGCSNVDRTVATATIPDDYHMRHPVVLANAPQTLDVFLVGTSERLDARQSRDVQVFAEDYLTHGQGRIMARLPRDAIDGPAANATLAAVKRALSAAGVKGEIEVGSYRAANPQLASALRLSFNKLEARLASHCGDWPDDLGSGTNVNEWDNRAYYNLGCATQQTLTAQIDDPRDLVRPRAEDPSDVQMRTRAIGDIRGSSGAQQGTDPSTAWGSTRPIQ